MRDYTKIVAWQKANDLVPLVYRVAEQLPRDEQYALVSQLKRAAVSIPTNIAEGAGRFSDRDFERFLSIAAGSASEVRYQLELVLEMWPSVDVGDALDLVHEVKRVLWSLWHASRSQ